MRPLSRRQKEVLNFCGEFFGRNDQLPSRKAICEHFGWASPNSAEEVLQALEAKGYIERNDLNKFRFTASGRAAAAITFIYVLHRWFPMNGSFEPMNGIGVNHSAV